MQSETSPDRVEPVERLAQEHAAAPVSKRTTPLLPRLDDDEAIIDLAHAHFQERAAQEQLLTYDAEWLLDNYYIVQRSIRQVRLGIPAGYYGQLPKLDIEPYAAGLPRIYHLALLLVYESRGRPEPETVAEQVDAYQRILPLTMGELWALPHMLRLALIALLSRSLADELSLPDDLAVRPAAREAHILPEQALDEQTTAADLVANAIQSLHKLETHDWDRFFEQVSLVERTLRTDPAGFYPRMDFATRDRYRAVVEELARYGDLDEGDVARTAIALCTAAADDPAAQDAAATVSDSVGPETDPVRRTEHVGYMLLDAGRDALEEAVDFRPPWSQRWRRWGLRRPTLLYLGSLSVVMAALLLALFSYPPLRQAHLAVQLLTALVALIPLSGVTVAAVNALLAGLFPPRILPKLDFSSGVPQAHRTMVVVPAMLATPAEVDSLLRQVEQHYLSNTDPEIGIALLTDFPDAPQETTPDDDALLARAKAGIDRLNQRYGGPAEALDQDGPAQNGQASGAQATAARARRPFFLFHRARRWNPQEDLWMGWERKRGKLAEFNRLLRGDDATSFTLCHGQLDFLSQVRYVITLDADTRLGPESARRLIATLAHPLNRAQFADELPDATARDAGEEVVAGYTILQPRTEILPTSANQSRFSRIFSGDSGFDLYTRAVSDLYQDLFGEGVFVGKGIYAVDDFMRTLRDRVPENTLLSHDLFEGIHGRAGLVSDVVVYEEYPASYLVHARRLHRWIRGDWQLLPWLGKRPPRAGASRTRSPLSLVDRWKIIDNLRRSLVEPAALLLLLLGWLALPGAPFFWTGVALAPLFMPFLITLANEALTLLQSSAQPRVARQVRLVLVRTLYMVAFLPHAAWLTLDAVARTLYRLRVSRRRLLEWTTAAQVERLFKRKRGVALAWGSMVETPLFTLVAALLLYVANPRALLVAGPFLVLWLIAPQLADYLGRPVSTRPQTLTAAEDRRLRLLARRTWLYFEYFVGPTDNWLPPDHFQESPLGVVAHRTSPTNIGLWLLSLVAAHDLGYESVQSTTVRLQNTFATLDELPRHRGHLLNWYDTRSLKPLPPRYVSMVDSGNLAGSLVALRSALQTLGDQPVLRPQRSQGLLDTLALLNDCVEAVRAGAPESGHRLHLAVDHLRATVQEVTGPNPQTTPPEPARLAALPARVIGRDLPAIRQVLQELMDVAGHDLEAGALRRMRTALDRLAYQLDDMARELETLAPWHRLLALPVDDLPAVSTEDGKLLQQVRAALPAHLSLRDTPAACADALQPARTLCARLGKTAAAQWCRDLAGGLEKAARSAQELLDHLAALDRQAAHLVEEMNFSFLYNPRRHVFHIGYNVDAGRLDNNYYDLLASEARIGSLVAIAKGDVPHKHWLYLGRPLTEVESTIAGGLHRQRALLSWSGTMFEYLMPLLLMRAPAQTLLYQSNQAVVDGQMAYAARHGLPWGISESGFYHFDANRFYQYQAFGVPGLGFKRGLGDQQVVSPYASLLALPLRPRAVVENLDRLEALGLMGDYGLYEAVDFTESRLPLGKSSAVVRSFMVHHQGMILLSLVNHLQNDCMVKRFHADPRIQSMDLLLQEQVPTHVPTEELGVENAAAPIQVETEVAATPWPVPLQSPTPQAHYLANGHYGVLITNGGGGYSRRQDRDLTRWRADSTLDAWGQWLYIRDEESGAFWSITEQPVGPTLLWGDDAPGRSDGAPPPVHREISFAPHQVDFHARTNGVASHMAVTVAPEDDVEVRWVRLVNQENRPRRLTLVSYGEVLLAEQSGDRRHPAFSKLFVESEKDDVTGALIFRRRPRAAGQAPIFLAHGVTMHPDALEHLSGPLRWETDRARFLGRGGTIRRPAALAGAESVLSNRTGATLDPILSLGCTVDLPPHGTVEVAFYTAAADDREEVRRLAQRYRAWSAVDRVYGHAQANAERELRRLDLASDEVARIQQLLSLLVYPGPALRAAPETLAANRLGQSALWPHAISGDYPILLVEVEDEEELGLLREVVRAHRYWRDRGLLIDLVVLNRDMSGYAQELQGALRRLLGRTESDAWLNRRGGIFLVRADTLDEDERALLETAARVTLSGHAGGLAHQLEGILQLPPRLPHFAPAGVDVPDAEAHADTAAAPLLARPDDLRFDNGLGGFTPDGREYVIHLEPGAVTPAPWTNVLANPHFGALVTESGLGYTWALNSGENRLTPWSNDPVTDPPGEAVYLRDEETGAIWSPTPRPTPAPGAHQIRHGAGYSRFRHHSHGLAQDLRVFVPPQEPVKVVTLTLENHRDRVRRITATYYAGWVLGVNRDETQQYIVPLYDEESGALTARNAYNSEFGERVAFLAADRPPHGVTTDRTEFWGRNGARSRPAALTRIGLSGRTEPGTDPCAAYQVHLDLEPGERAQVHFFLGQAADLSAAQALLADFRQPDRVEQAWQALHAQWDAILGAVQVQTPAPAMDLLLNRWLLYQNLACRIWGRSAFYQSSGAYGFRDQLQDVMALLHSRPDVAREQILRAAAHQFQAGDVLHWWHPPSGRGVRTRISDDLLWLPYVTAVYVETTGDRAILDETAPFLMGKPLEDDEEERYGHWERTQEHFSLYEHCLRALDRGDRTGRHGLPLMGGGDWNDGMNRVGIHGQGESVWLAWFLSATLDRFAPLCAQQGDRARATTMQERAATLRAAVDAEAWDGDWYLRGFYDDGAPLGSRESQECRIDAIAQSWSVLSRPADHAAGDAADPARVTEAMESVAAQLVDRDAGLIRLFTPPFDRTEKDPGYIKGYPPGIRENGGQYTHAALWTVWAFAELGQGDRAGAAFGLLNPIHHGADAETLATYRVEPYVVAADVYGAPPHVGRGGWTWYTGSAGWMYRLGVEAILGIRRLGDRLTVDPTIPSDWDEYQVEVRVGKSCYRIRVENPHGVSRGVVSRTLDGEPVAGDDIPLRDDGARHTLVVRMGE